MTYAQTPSPSACRSLDAARRVLTAALQTHSEEDSVHRAAAEALAALTDVTLPSPPPPSTRVEWQHALLASALEHLDAAIGEARSIDELTRIATASLILRRRAPDLS